MGLGGMGRGTGQEADGERLCVRGGQRGTVCDGTSGEARQGGRSLYEEGCATRGRAEQDEHQAGGGLPRMDKQKISS